MQSAVRRHIATTIGNIAATLAIVTTALFGTILTNTPTATAAADTIACNSVFYQVSSGKLYTYNAQTNQYAAFGSGTVTGLNALAYNPADSYLYAIASNNLYKINNSGTHTNTGAISPNVGSPAGGDLLPDGRLLATGTSTTGWWAIDTTTRTATNIPVTGTWGAYDLTLVGDKGYGLSGSTLYEVTFTTNTNGTVTAAQSRAISVTGVTTGQYGAAFSDTSGTLYFFNNTDAKLYQFDNTADTSGTLVIQQATLSAPNDGANCHLAPSPFAAPVANNDTYTTYTNTPTTVTTNGVLANDTGGTELSISTHTNPTHGTLELNTDGTFTYTPDTDYIGTDTFTYTSTDSQPTPKTSNTATVTITVTGHGTVHTDPVVDIGTTDATFHGTINAQLATITPWFCYGTAADGTGCTRINADQTSITGNTDTDINVTVTGLEEHTTYWVYAAGDLADGSTITSTGVTFTTNTAAHTVVEATNTASAIVDQNTTGRTDTGDTIDYTYTVTNTGNTIVNTAVITDDRGSSDGITCSGGGNTVGPLNVGDTATCTRTVVLEQTDIDHGSISTTVTATATSDTAEAIGNDTETVEIVQHNTITIDTAVVDIVDVDSNSTDSTGDTISYKYTITNTGTTTLHNITVDGNKTPADTIGCHAIGITATDGSQIATLAAGDSIECDASHTIDTDDITNTTVTNIGHVEAQTPDGTSISDTDVDETTLDIGGVGTETRLTIAIVSTTIDNTLAGGNGRTDNGDSLEYTYTITNTGNTTLLDVTAGSDATRCDTPTPTTLAAGGSITCTASTEIGQDTIDAGEITVQASASGTDGTNSVSDTATTTTVIAHENGIEIHAGVTDKNSCATIETSLTVTRDTNLLWCYIVTNTGNTTIDNIVVYDTGNGIGGDKTITGSSGRIRPGETVEYTNTTAATETFDTVVHANGTVGSELVQSDALTANVTVISYGTVTGVLWIDTRDNEAHDADEPALAGATVRLIPTGSPAGATFGATPLSDSEQTTVTDADGTYTFNNVPTGSYFVFADVDLPGLGAHADSDGGHDWTVAVSVSADSTTGAVADFAGRGSSTLDGNVINITTGKLIPDADVKCTWGGVDGKQGTADDIEFKTVSTGDGTYTLDGLPWGDYTCIAQSTTGNTTSWTPTIVSDGNTTIDAEFTSDTPGEDRGAGEDGTLPTAGGNTDGPLKGAALLLGAGIILQHASRRRKPAR